MTKWVIYLNKDIRNGLPHRWDLMRLDKMMVEPDCPFPPCDHKTAQYAFNCLVSNYGYQHFELEIIP